MLLSLRPVYHVRERLSTKNFFLKFPLEASAACTPPHLRGGSSLLEASAVSSSAPGGKPPGPIQANVEFAANKLTCARNEQKMQYSKPQHSKPRPVHGTPRPVIPSEVERKRNGIEGSESGSYIPVFQISRLRLASGSARDDIEGGTVRKQACVLQQQLLTTTIAFAGDHHATELAASQLPGKGKRPGFL